MPLADDSWAVVTLCSAAPELVTRGFRVPSSPPTGCNSVRKQAATAAIRKEGKLTWHHNAPRKDRWLTLTLPPPILSSRLCPHSILLMQKLKGSLLQVREKQALPGRLQVRNAQLCPPLPLLPRSLKAGKLPSPHSSSHLLCTLHKSLIKQLGRGKGGTPLSAGGPSAWQYMRHFSVDYSGSMSLTEVSKP